MFIQHFLLAALWLLFALFHSIFASSKWKKSMQEVMKKNYKFYRVLYSLFSLIFLTAIIIYQLRIKTVALWKTNPAETIIAITGIIAGAIVMIYFAGKFFFDLSGADIFLKTRKTSSLISNSFYKYVRHPLYAATLLFIWSIFFWQPLLDNFVSCVCITVYTIIGIHFEEKKLIKDFGESYVQYRSETPMLIPKFLLLKR